MVNRGILEETVQLIRERMAGRLASIAIEEFRVGIIGPTASMVPDVYFREGVDVMAGVRITDSELMLRILGEGGSGYHLSDACAKRVVFVNNDGGKPWKQRISTN